MCYFDAAEIDITEGKGKKERYREGNHIHIVYPPKQGIDKIAGYTRLFPSQLGFVDILEERTDYRNFGVGY